MFLSHFKAGSGAVAVETREESRLLLELLQELPSSAEVAITSAPSGGVYRVRLEDGRVSRDKDPFIKGTMGQMTLAPAYEWLAKSASRVLYVLDWHMLCNSPGHWRLLIESLPGIRCPEGTGNASMVVFVGPTFDFIPQNPLRGNIPVLGFDPPNRAALKAIASGFQPFPDTETEELVADALCGLGADVAEQCAAESLVANSRDGVASWNPTSLNEARRAALRQGGLEIWKPVPELAGLDGFKGYIQQEVIPWLRDGSLSVRRILNVGIPGSGKSMSARWIAAQIGCECVSLSVSAMKAGIVGQSEAQLKRAFTTLDAMAAEAPLLVVMDELDKVATTGLDGGTSQALFGATLQWLNDSKSLCVVVATCNNLELINAALESRFAAKFFFENPGREERIAVAAQHFRRVGCTDEFATMVADKTAGFSNREIAIGAIPSIARLSNRQPTEKIIKAVCESITPASVTQVEQLEKMRNAAQTLRKANSDSTTASILSGNRKVNTGLN